MREYNIAQAITFQETIVHIVFQQIRTTAKTLSRASFLQKYYYNDGLALSHTHIHNLHTMMFIARYVVFTRDI